MDERTQHEKREFTIEVGFECSRLEKRLLAQVYEHIVPLMTRSVLPPMVASEVPRCLSDQLQRAQTGA